MAIFTDDRKANDKKHAFERPGYDELTDLIEFCTQNGAGWTVSIVRQLQDDVLKPFLLAFAGRGTFNQAADLVKHRSDSAAETETESSKEAKEHKH